MMSNFFLILSIALSCICIVVGFTIFVVNLNKKINNSNHSDKTYLSSDQNKENIKIICK